MRVIATCILQSLVQRSAWHRAPHLIVTLLVDCPADLSRLVSFMQYGNVTVKVVHGGLRSHTGASMLPGAASEHVLFQTLRLHS